MWSNTSIERVKWGEKPRPPLSNDQRLQVFRRRHAATCTTEFNTAFLSGKIQSSDMTDAKR